MNYSHTVRKKNQPNKQKTIFNLYSLSYLVALKDVIIFEIELNFWSVNVCLENGAIQVVHVADFFFQHLVCKRKTVV